MTRPHWTWLTKTVKHDTHFKITIVKRRDISILLLLVIYSLFWAGTRLLTHTDESLGSCKPVASFVWSHQRDNWSSAPLHPPDPQPLALQAHATPTLLSMKKLVSFVGTRNTNPPVNERVSKLCRLTQNKPSFNDRVSEQISISLDPWDKNDFFRTFLKIHTLHIFP